MIELLRPTDSGRAEKQRVQAGGRILILALALASSWAAGPAQADPNALWNIVHGQCVPDQTEKSDPAPCAAVDLAEGVALLKDLHGATQYLLIATQRLGGIESPEILAAGAPNYWDDAWRLRHFVEDRAGKPIPRDEIGMAINSPYGRSQNQFHIHIDCVLPAVRDALRANEAKIGPTWSDLDADIVGHHYRAMRLDGDDLGERNPFKILADNDPAARADMARETLAVIGMVFGDGKPGFVLLSSRAPTGLSGTLGMGSGIASSEVLLDHDCAVLR
jgi:CDP-diacylglycerol pyrophosphatase